MTGEAGDDGVPWDCMGLQGMVGVGSGDHPGMAGQDGWGRLMGWLSMSYDSFPDGLYAWILSVESLRSAIFGHAVTNFHAPHKKLFYEKS